MNKQNSGFFNWLDKIDSTNNYAMAKVHAGLATHGMAWFAKEQTAGKGQRGRHWASEPGQNIALSISVQPFGLSGAHQFLLSAATALGCYDFFSKYTDENVAIKWPNDLYWRDRKAGGILIENVFKGENWAWAVIGIGININQTQFGDDINAVSLQQITGKSYDVAMLSEELYDCIIQRLESLPGRQFKKIIDEYNEHLFKKNCMVSLKKDNIRFNTTIQKVNDYGQLMTKDTLERVFNWGEVKWIL